MLTKTKLATLKWSKQAGQAKLSSLLPVGSKSTIKITSKPEGKLGKYYVTHTVTLEFGPNNEFRKEWKSRAHLKVAKAQAVEVVSALIDAGAEFYL